MVFDQLEIQQRNLDTRIISHLVSRLYRIVILKAEREFQRRSNPPLRECDTYHVRNIEKKPSIWRGGEEILSTERDGENLIFSHEFSRIRTSIREISARTAIDF